MSDEIKTVRVKPWSESQGDFVVINEADFDASAHEMYEDAPQEAADKPRRGRPPKQDATE